MLHGSNQRQPAPRVAVADGTFPDIRSARDVGPRRTELASQSLARQLRAKRSEMMIVELEAVALRLFEQRGFDITVEEIALEAQISVRTFYRYFPAKDDVLQLRIDRRSEALRAALSGRPADEPPLHSLHASRSRKWYPRKTPSFFDAGLPSSQPRRMCCGAS